MTAFTWPPDDTPARSLDPDLAEPIAAAVLVAVYPARGGPRVVLTRRRADLRRHAGEISFPGGRRDPEDVDLTETALREAEEEIGLHRDEVAVLGELPTTSTFATNYLIHPFVGAIRAGIAWELSPKEVDAVLELSLAEVRAGRTVATLERRGVTFRTDAYLVGEHLIWGATARIIEHLLTRLQEDVDGALALRAEGPES
ncbi:MAG: NUDIX hydrolase [Solirubrobacteraceae bacterium]